MTKKILPGLILISFLAVLLIPITTQAQVPPCPSNQNACQKEVTSFEQGGVTYNACWCGNPDKLVAADGGVFCWANDGSAQFLYNSREECEAAMETAGAGGTGGIAGGPLSCCKLGRDIKLGDVTYKDTHWIGEKNCDGKITADCPISGDTTGNCYTSKWGMICLLNTLYGVTDWVFVALIAVTGIMVIMGAFNIVTAGGDSEKVGTGRNYIIYAAVGLAVGLLARAIPGIVQAIVGG